MVFKIFTKIGKNGKLVSKEYKNFYYESDNIRIEPIPLSDNVFKYSVEVGNGADMPIETGLIDMAYQGYEIYSNAGVLVEKMITKENI